MRTWIVALCLMLACQVSAAPPEAGLAITLSEDLLESGDVDGALEILAPYKDSDDAEVAYAIAYANWIAATNGRRMGDADAELVSRAIRHAERAVAMGRADGFNLLYMIHANATESPQGRALAIDYLERGVEAGDKGSMLNYMNSLYFGSALFARDVEAACPLALQLAGDEHAGAIAAHVLGLIMIRGECGRPAAPAGGVDLLRVAAEHGVRDAEFDLAQALEHGVGAKAAPLEALRWYQSAADHGHPKAHWKLGMAYVAGVHRKPDPAEAVAHFRRSVEGGDPDGMTSLAVMYASGSGVVQDFARAIALYEDAARLGHPHAMRGLAVMHMLGEGVEVDLVRARLFYLQAVALGNPEEPNLERMILSGMVGPQRDEAQRLFEEWERGR